MALAGGVTAYDLIATDDEQLTTAPMRLVTGLDLVGGIPPWCHPITLSSLRGNPPHRFGGCFAR